MKSTESKGEPETTTEMMGKKQVQRERREPSFSEYLTLWWVWPLVRKGFRSALNEEDIPRSPESFEAENLLNRASAFEMEDNPSIWRVVWNLNKHFILCGSLAGSTQGLLNTVGRPFVLREIIKVATSDSESGNRLAWLIILFAAIVYLEGFFGVVNAHLLTDILGARFSSVVSGMVICKSLKRGRRLDAGAPVETSLAGNDIVRTMENLRLTQWVPMLITALIGGITVLVVLIGVSSVVGLFVMFSIVGLNRYISSKTKKAEKLNLKAGDKRLTLMRQLIEGIQALKMHGWEAKFLSKIEKVREDECVHIQNYRILQVVSIALGRASPVLASCAAFITFVLMGNTLRPADIFAALTIFQALRMPLIMIPLSLTALMNIKVSLKRIESFLQIPNVCAVRKPDQEENALEIHNGDFSWTKPPPSSSSSSSDCRSSGGDGNTETRSGDKGSTACAMPSVEEGGGATSKLGMNSTVASKAALHLTKDTKASSSSQVTVGGRNDISLEIRGSAGPKNSEQKSSQVGSGRSVWTLRNVNVTVKRGSKVAIVGAVGAGKSSLLHALLGDLVTSDRTKVSRTESCGWVPQKAFVLSATVRDNILMGRPFDPQRFQWAIWASSMERDLTLLPNGQYTEIGERGTTLSGGQQQRLAIARAVYGTPDMLVMDDPLAAVDSKVTETIFRRCVHGYTDPDKSKGSSIASGQDAKRLRCVVMALNQVHLLQRFDHIVYMENGLIEDQGSFEELTARRHPGFMQLLKATEEAGGGGSIDDLKDDADSRKGAIKKRSCEKGSSLSPDGKREGLDAKPPNADEGSDVKLENEKEDREGGGARAQGNSLVASTTSAEKSYQQKQKKKKKEEEDADDKRLASLLTDNNIGGKNKKSVANMIREGTLVDEEKLQKGAVTSDVVMTYIRSMGVWFVALCGVVLLLAYATFVFNDVWLAIWAGEAPESTSRNLFYIGIYIGTSIGHVCLILLMSCLMAVGGVRASHVLHKECLERVIKAPTKWFEETPSGRIMSRFSSDLGVVDIRLALYIDNYLQIGAIIFVLLATMCVTVPPVTGFVVFGMVLYLVEVLAVDRANREVRRMVNNAMSPMLTNFSETANGRLITQTMGLQSYFLKRHLEFTDRFSSMSLASFALINWGRHTCNVASFSISLATALLVLLQRDRYSETQISLALTYAFLVPYFLMVQSMNASFISVGFTSLERVLEYKSENIPQESAWRQKGDPNQDEWPSKGKISFEDVMLVYRPGLPPAIKDVSFSINAGESCGVVGRTGAGKSSLVVLLFRIVEKAAGRILIDGCDIRTLGLQTVREALAIIPQHPLLLQGTVRHNLDPFSEFSDNELGNVLVDIGLSASLLHSEVGPGGSFLSAGERQLISFGRAMVRHARIVVMDEPTANIDINTDNKIQEIVRDKFKGSTIITIAHRLSTIIDYDKVLVMDAGKVAEFGPAAELLENPHGILTGMVESSGPEAAKKLRAQAQTVVRKMGLTGLHNSRSDDGKESLLPKDRSGYSSTAEKNAENFQEKRGREMINAASVNKGVQSI